MPKERSINPAQAQHKADKAKAIKKGKAEATNRRTEKLSRRNPERLQKQLDDLTSLSSTGQKLTSHEKTLLESLEKEIKAIRKARETLGDAAPKFNRDRDRNDREGGVRGGRGGGRGGSGVLGKRRREGEGGESSEGSEIDEEVKRIPMPRDTPPPIPKPILDAWYQKRRERLGIQHNNQNRDPNHQRGSGTSANSTPLGGNARTFGTGEGIPERHNQQEKPKVETKTVYESAPVIRDLRKEAVAFVPAVVRAKLDKLKAPGGLVEPEEADALEKAGYLGKRKEEDSGERSTGPRGVEMEEVDDEEG